MLTIIMIVSIIIVLVVLLLAVLTTSKAYTFKHTVDPIVQEDTENEESESYKKDSKD